MSQYQHIVHLGVGIPVADLNLILDRSNIQSVDSLQARIRIVTESIATSIAILIKTITIPNHHLYVFTFPETLFQDFINAYDLSDARILNFIRAAPTEDRFALSMPRQGNPANGTRYQRALSYEFATRIGEHVCALLQQNPSLQNTGAQFIIENSLFILGTVLCYSTDLKSDRLRKVDNLAIVCRPLYNQHSKRFDCDVHITEKIFNATSDTMPLFENDEDDNNFIGAPAPLGRTAERLAISRTLRHAYKHITPTSAAAAAAAASSVPATESDLAQHFINIMLPTNELILTSFEEAVRALKAGNSIETALQKMFPLSSAKSFDRFIGMAGNGTWSKARPESTSSSAFFSHPTILNTTNKQILFALEICVDHANGILTLLSAIRSRLYPTQQFIPDVYLLISYKMLLDYASDPEFDFFSTQNVIDKPIVSLQNDGSNEFKNTQTYISHRRAHTKIKSHFITLKTKILNETVHFITVEISDPVAILP